MELRKNFYERIKAIDELLKEETQGELELSSKKGYISYHCSCGQGEDVPVADVEVSDILWKCPKMHCSGKITIEARKSNHV